MSRALTLGWPLSGAQPTPNPSSVPPIYVPPSGGGGGSSTVPNAPSISLSATNGQISVSWLDGYNGGAAITSHNLYRGTAANALSLVGSITTASPYIDSGLTNGTVYYYALTAVNSVGESAQSSVANASPGFPAFDFTAGSLPSGVTATGGNGGTATNSAGSIAAATAPRFDYQSGTAALASEEAATNYLLQSANLSAAPWALKTVTIAAPGVTANAATAPDGNNTATQVVIPANSATGQQSNVQQLISGLTAGQKYIASFWYKGNAGQESATLGVQDGANPYGYVGTRRVAGKTTWQRAYVAFTPSGTSVYLSFGTDTQSGAVSNNNFYIAGGTFFVWGFQVEKANSTALPTSYIPTTTAAANRTADTVSFTQPSGAMALSVLYDDGSSQVLNQAAGAVTLTPSSMRRRRIKTITPLASVSSRPITGITYGSLWRYNSVSGQTFQGDTFQNTWADDGKIYSMGCDTNGWNNADTGTASHNVMLSTMSTFGTDTVGTKVNSMTQFGAAPGQGGTNLGSDNAAWKSTGLISISGVLYIIAGRNVYGTQSSRWKQTVTGGSIFKSVDHGVTITPQPPALAQPLASPMFPAAKFANANFVQYGQDYQGNTVHNSNNYVYAVSNDGAWNDGSTMILGRCLISDMAAQDGTKWTFYQGGDGMLDANWGPMSSAATILSKAGSVSSTNVQYHSYCGRYSMFQWFYPRMRDEAPPSTYNSSSQPITQDTWWELYESPTPWGPWALVQSDEWSTDGFYNPAVIQKSISTDGGKTVVLAASGDYSKPSSEYTFTEFPVVLAN